MTCAGFMSSDVSATPVVAFDRNEIKPRVESMDCFVRNRFNSDTERHVKGFVLLARKNAERVLGESTIYFPIIEEKLKELGLPDDLKYLPVVESMLRPKAVSGAGAKGMWQLMPFIAEDYSLKMDDLKDERFHVEKSTEAGLLYLKKLYDRFENWELALAAYNCGSNRVRKTLRASGKKTYWGIRHLLPRQTREFIPKLVAAKYLFRHYKDHGMQPAFPSIDAQLTRTIQVEGGQSYEDISMLTGIRPGMLAFMNPHYIYDPKYTSKEKLDIILPARVANVVLRHQEWKKAESVYKLRYSSDSTSVSNPYFKVIYAVPDSMNIQAFCDMYNLSHTQVWLWNELTNEQLTPGQELFVYSYRALKLNYQTINVSLEKIASQEINEIPSLRSVDLWYGNQKLLNRTVFSMVANEESMSK